ncbi:hypothetical protein [Dechloromonas sp. CZR5]|uniref:hypothetical protein n=1 Tax=Dechloromonas sp. CZR5 TaxID=2608630 RepID=UPI00123D3EFF|nr:hypothetical protein [Dechloromonas sp. CZR5]
MTRPTPIQPRDLWEKDGALRDVYVLDTALTDWALLLSLAGKYGYRYLYEGQDRPLPEVEKIFTARDGAHLLSVKLGRVTANCHFFVPDEIELDLDPREVQSDADHYEVLQFLEALAKGTNKKVSVTTENAQDMPYLSYDPLSHEWSIYEPPAVPQ